MTDQTTQALAPELPELPEIGNLIPPEMQRDIHEMMRAYALAAIAADRNKREVSAGLSDEIQPLITEVINAAFDCGAYDGEAEGYKPIVAKSKAAREALIRALESRLRLPEGWVAVPKEPTEEMIDAGCECEPATKWGSNGEVFCERYKAAIAAAPLPKQEG